MAGRPVLSARHLNRALLAGQMLLRRTDLPIERVVEQMGGIQMQYAPSGYIGLWSRMRDFDRPMLTRALEERRLVQGTLLRSTIHTVSAEDYWPMMAGIRRVNREWYSKAQARAMAGTDMDGVARAVRDELSDGPLPVRQLTERLVARGVPAPAVGWAGLWVEIVRVPPSGTWERRRADLYGLASDWLGPPPPGLNEEDGIELLVRRYLGAFGPAPPRDIASWMGFKLGQMRHVLDRMELRTLRGPDGKPLLELPGAELPDPDAPAPPRFLGTWEALLLVHARRTGVLPEAYRSRIFNTKAPHSFNTFLVDGEVAGTWRFEDGEVRLEPFAPLTATDRGALEAEAEGLAALHR